MNIALVYIGERRFQKTTKENHKRMLVELEKNFSIKIYDFIKDGPNRSCPFEVSGAVQLWDFVNAIDSTREDIVIKIRTDVWFTKSSIKILKEKLKEVVSGELDLAYLGIDLRNHYDKEYVSNILIDSKSKCTDFVIIARKDKIRSSKDCIQPYLEGNPEKSGNKAFKRLIDINTKTVAVSCQMYLVRTNFKNPTDYEVLKYWANEYKKTEEANSWISNNKKIIEQF